MSPIAKVKELLDVDTLRQVFVYLLGAVLSLIGFEYFRITGEIESKLSALESRIEAVSDAATSRSERLRVVEENANHVKEDVTRIRDDIRGLSNKIDRLTEQLYEANRSRTSVLHSSTI